MIYIILNCCIDFEDVEDDSDCHYRVFGSEIQIRLLDLLLNLTFFKMLLFLFHEIEGLLVLSLLRQYFHVELAEVCIDDKRLFFHKFQ